MNLGSEVNFMNNVCWESRDDMLAMMLLMDDWVSIW